MDRARRSPISRKETLFKVKDGPSSRAGHSGPPPRISSNADFSGNPAAKWAGYPSYPPRSGNSLAVFGRLRIARLEPVAGQPRDLALAVELLEGSLKIDFPAGESRILVEADRCSIDLTKARAHLGLIDDALSVFVYLGEAHVRTPKGNQITIRIGQRCTLRCTLRHGILEGTIDAINYAKDPW